MTRRDQARLARLACERKAAEVRLEMGRGKTGLATVGVTAAFLGILLTAWQIEFVCFGNPSGEKTAVMIRTRNCVAEEQWPSIVGAVVSIAAYLGYRAINGAVESAEVEMKIAILELDRILLTLS